jgi:hypothetical protein
MMKPLPRIIEAKPLKGFLVEAHLTDGSIRKINIAPYLRGSGPLFKEVRENQKLFCQVKADHGTLIWPNGLDFCPDVLLETEVFLQARRVLAKYLKRAVPAICQFEGASVYVYPEEHGGPPHIHVIKAENNASVEILTGKISKGNLPVSLRRTVRKWLKDQRLAVFEAYARAQAGQPPGKVAPPN